MDNLRERIAQKFWVEHYKQDQDIIWDQVGKYIKDECYRFADSIINLLAFEGYGKMV
jgi:hypothetical protein